MKNEQYRFKVIDDNLIECIDTESSETFLLTLDEARTLGCKIITYKGKPITYYDMGRLIGKSCSSIWSIVQLHNFTTGEQIIEYYSKKYVFTYQGDAISFKEFAKIINKNPTVLSQLVNKYGYTTGEQIIEHYKQKYKLKYKGESISINQFAKIVNKNTWGVTELINRHRFTTGEQIIEYYNSLSMSQFTYCGSGITVKDFGRIIGKSQTALNKVISKHKFKTEEEIIDFYKKPNKQKGKLKYKGESISIHQFAKIVNKAQSTLSILIDRHNFTTGEQIIEYYKQIGKL